MASTGDGGGSSWPTSLSTPETDELIRLGLMVPLGCRLPHVFHITADGYPTRGPGATPAELRQHEGGRWNIVGRTRFWKGKDFSVVVAQARREIRTGDSSSGPGGSPARLPAELQAALDAAATMAAAAEAVELQAALDAAAAIEAAQPQISQEQGDDGYWEDGGKSSDDGDSDDDRDVGAGEIVDLADSGDDELIRTN
ncbi:hypothetical protein VPH35_075912 [Triticum aestivum]